MSQDRLIFHIDVNSAFLSWEALERLKEDPNAVDLRLIPSAIGGDAKTRHGIILAKSTPAKAYGVVTAEPLVQALRKCPELCIVPPRFEAYVRNSRKLISLLEEYSPDIEKFSIDEAFLDMTQTIHLFGEPVTVANALRKRVEAELGFTVNVGIAPNKLLAKMASDFKKPNLCHTLFPEEVPVKMWPLPVEALFFAGPAACGKLRGLGIKTIGDLAQSSVRQIQATLGSKFGQLIHDYANGIDESPVEARAAASKGCGNSITLSRDISDTETARQVLLSLCETVGARLRADHLRGSCVCVELKDTYFKKLSHQTTLLSPTDSTGIIYETACQLLDEFWHHVPLRLMGVRVTKLSDDSFVQLNLFDSGKSEKLEKLDKAVDSIRNRFGTDAVKRASFLEPGAICDHAAGKNKHLPK